MDQAKPSTTHGSMGTGLGFAKQRAVGQVEGGVRNVTDLLLCFKPELLAGYQDLCLALYSEFKAKTSANVHFEWNK